MTSEVKISTAEETATQKTSGTTSQVKLTLCKSLESRNTGNSNINVEGKHIYVAGHLSGKNARSRVDVYEKDLKYFASLFNTEALPTYFDSRVFTSAGKTYVVALNFSQLDIYKSVLSNGSLISSTRLVHSPAFAFDVDQKTNLAYVLTYDGLSTIDLNNPLGPEEISFISDVGAGLGLNLLNVLVDRRGNGVLYVVSPTNSTFAIFDIKKQPERPVLIENFKSKFIPHDFSQSPDGKKLFIGGLFGLLVFDVNDPWKAELVEKIDTLRDSRTFIRTDVSPDGRYLLMISFGKRNLASLHSISSSGKISAVLSSVELLQGSAPADTKFVDSVTAIVTNTDKPTIQVLHIV